MNNISDLDEKKQFPQVKLETPKTRILDRNCRWGCPEFVATDGIEQHPLWQFNGLTVAIGFIDRDHHKIIGSGVMVAPGLCLTATHVIEEIDKKQALIYAFACESSMRIWAPDDFHAQKFVLSPVPFRYPEEKLSDVGVVSCSPFSRFGDKEDFLFAPLRVTVPMIGERLWATGYREISNDGVPTVAFFISSGLVTEQYIEGRGAHLKGPCIEVAMKTKGGMSGGAVFNQDGHIVGVISSCVEGVDDDLGPTYVSLVWPSLLSNVRAPWPEGYWPDQIGGLQVLVDSGGAKVLGSARWNDDGSLMMKLHRQSEEQMRTCLLKAGVVFESKDYTLSEFAYEEFEEYLEQEGLRYLLSTDRRIFDKALSTSESTEAIKFFSRVDVSCHEGLEDLSIQSISLLDCGNIGVDVTFEIHGSFMLLEITNAEYKLYKDLIDRSENFHNKEFVEDKFRCEHYVRPYYRVNFKYNPKEETFEGAKFQMVRLEV